MKAIVFEEFQGVLTLKDVPEPTPSDDGVVIKVNATGLCRSDWHGWMGHDPDIKLPHVPGHELAGTIAAIGKSVQNVSIGDRVTVPFVCGCGSCGQCRSGNHQVCDNQTQPGFTHWGSFAEYVAIENADINVVKIPDEISHIEASILGCRFITSYRAVVDQGKIKSGQYVVVHGCGGVGLSTIMIANAKGAQVIAVDIHDDTLDFAREMGAVSTINASKTPDLVSEVKALTHGGAHISLDALGSQTTCFNSIANLRKRGKHIQVGLMTGSHQHPKVPMGLVLANELEIIGSHGMQAHRYPELLELIRIGKLNPIKLIDRTISLEEVSVALPQMDKFENKGVTVIDTF
nr:zinc-dependent alcohol dehydrogenase family protein [uncultured Allomuricauda sp.]